MAQMLVNYNKPEVSERTLMALRRSTRLPQQTSDAGGNLDNAGVALSFFRSRMGELGREERAIWDRSRHV
jgi:hypothetical protein